jgi:hypothetical protein
LVHTGSLGLLQSALVAHCTQVFKVPSPTLVLQTVPGLHCALLAQWTQMPPPLQTPVEHGVPASTKTSYPVVSHPVEPHSPLIQVGCPQQLGPPEPREVPHALYWH